VAVHEEIETENLSEHRDRYEGERNTTLVQLQRLEAKTQRHFELKQKRKSQRDVARKEVRRINREAAEFGLSQFYATGVFLHAIDILERKGFFYDFARKKREVILAKKRANGEIVDEQNSDLENNNKSETESRDDK
jgi:hypothetical protein